MKKIDPSKFSCPFVADRGDGTREMWIRYNGELVARGAVIGSVGCINAQNKDYKSAARTYLQENFPEYEWR